MSGWKLNLLLVKCSTFIDIRYYYLIRYYYSLTLRDVAFQNSCLIDLSALQKQKQNHRVPQRFVENLKAKTVERTPFSLFIPLSSRTLSKLIV